MSFRRSSLLALATTLALAVASTAALNQTAQADPDDGPTVGLRLVADGLTSPVALTEAPDGSDRLFVVDQVGLVRVLTPDGTLLEEPFLDLRDRMVALRPGYDERGLLGFAFHPDYADNGRFFVYYSAPLRHGAPEGFNHTSHIAEFQVSAADPNRADPGSERILLQVDQPQSNHNAGTLAFGPDDGYLYISLGDGGAANDVATGHVEDWYDGNAGGNAQNVSANLLGKILRIDVDAGDPYGIPADNPFVGTEGLDEIYAYGFRNPYRFAFDPGGDHDLLVGDAGQDLWEEVSRVSKGGNYGWNVREGAHCFDAENPDTSPADCPDMVTDGPRAGDPLVDPVIDFANSNQPDGLGATVVGGHVYRGDLLPQFDGRYVFGVWSTSFTEANGNVFVAKPRREGLWEFQRVVLSGSPDGGLHRFLLGFGQDADGEVYLLTTDNSGPRGQTGRVFQLVRPGQG